MNKVSERTCISCRQIKNKKDLSRIVRNKEGRVFVDETGKQNGRGAYVCKTLECVEKCRKTKALDRHLNVKVPDEVYQQLKNGF